jgi:hypothetical protein
MNPLKRNLTDWLMAILGVILTAFVGTILIATILLIIRGVLAIWGIY